MTAQGKTETAQGSGATGLILLGVLLTALGIVWAVSRGSVAIPMITGPVCLIAGIARIGKGKTARQ